MEYTDFENEIIGLIDCKTEGNYWDFKREWHSNNADLLHDIICMANSLANRDGYIIIGVEDKTFTVCGVDQTVNRKNQQNVIDLLRQKPKWAGGYIPEVYVKTIVIYEKELDVIVVKQSDNTPFYLLEDYKNEGGPLFKGAIYIRKGDSNTPKTSTADIYDTEMLWKRRFGLLYNPSQRAKHYLEDCDNWEMVDGDADKEGVNRFFFYYKPDPDYTIHIVDSGIEELEIARKVIDINDNSIGSFSYYLFAFCNVSYHTDYSDTREVRLFYKDIPLFSSYLECIDEGRTQIIPPELPEVDAYYIEDSFRYLIFQFVFSHICRNYSKEAQEMIYRVVPVYYNQREHDEFLEYVKARGYGIHKILGEKIKGEALERLQKIEIGRYEGFNVPTAAKIVTNELNGNSNLVINFARPENVEYGLITERLKRGKMFVDWLKEWRNIEEKVVKE